MTKINSTLGFIYTPDYQYVLLIRKQKPVSHAGKLNGLGGKLEADESMRQCLSREVKEESLLDIDPESWQPIATMSWQEWYVEVFATVYHGQLEDIASLGSEEVGWYKVCELPKEVISNLPWLIPLGVDVLTNDAPPAVVVTYATAR
jgi:8-oxo-dGTP diphosphatase